MGYFGESTQRIQEFREELLNTPSYICAERGRLYTQAYSCLLYTSDAADEL